MRAIALLGVACLGGVLGAIGACSSTPSAQAETDDLIGGVDAKSASLDAIGALMLKDPMRGLTQFCTATLIAPRVVLSAKHCAVEKNLDAAEGGAPIFVDTRFIDVYPIYFAIGPDSANPKRLVEAESVETCNLGDVGFMGLGCDVSVYHLKEAVDDVRPFKVATGSIGADAVGKPLSAVGYGNQDERGTVWGTRKAGTLTLRSVRGAPMHTLFPNVDGFLDAMRAAEGEAYVNNADASLRAFYDSTLLDGYEAFAGAAEGNAQVCGGDSGGPLLAKIDGELVVQGVASGTVSGVRLPCKLGAVYGTFGPKAQELITRSMNDECDGIPAEGRCEGDVAVRCTTSIEGPRRVTRTDCSELLQRCVVPPPSSAGDGGDAGPNDLFDAGPLPPPDGGGLPFDAGGPVPLPPPVRHAECAD